MNSKFLIFVLFWSLTISLKAQTDTVAIEGKDTLTTDVSIALNSRYVWRGSAFSNGPVLQPDASFTYKGFSIGAWGSININNDPLIETDLYCNYTFADEMFTIGITDYYVSSFDSVGVESSYFYEYQKDKTSHILEGSLSFNGVEKFPLSFLFAFNFYGADKRYSDNSLMYSTYLELAYDIKGVKLFSGFTLNKIDSSKGETGFYADKPGLVNLGLSYEKKIEITEKYSLPINFSISANPISQKLFFVAGITF